MEKGKLKRSREEIEKMLKRLKPALRRRWKVKRIGIFGSYARDEQVEASDVDILVEFYEPLGWEIVDLKEYLEEKLGLQVDLATRGALKPRIRDDILREVIYA